VINREKPTGASAGDTALMSYKGAHCDVTLERLCRGVVLVRISGQDAGELGSAPRETLAGLLQADAPADLFIDARNAQSASLDVSGEWARWLVKNRPFMREIHMLARSRFVQMTADFVRRYAGLDELMRVYTNEALFDEALAQRRANK
jgi:hypothetical protein